MTNNDTRSSVMTFIFQIDMFFINYLCNDDMLPLWYVKFSAIYHLKVHWFHVKSCAISNKLKHQAHLMLPPCAGPTIKIIIIR